MAPNRLVVAYGTNTWKSNENLAYLEKFVSHPNYSPTRIDWDYSYMILQEEVVFSDSVRPISLVPPNENSKVRVSLFSSSSNLNFFFKLTLVQQPTLWRYGDHLRLGLLKAWRVGQPNRHSRWAPVGWAAFERLGDLYRILGRFWASSSCWKVLRPNAVLRRSRHGITCI